jgi:hypothetical protein
MNTKHNSLHRGYPLNTLFLLIAASAVVTGMIAPLARGRSSYSFGGNEVIGSAILGWAVLTIVGAVVGLFHHSRLHGSLWGIMVGGLLGVIFGPVILIPARDFSLVLLTSFGGGAVILATGTVIRLTTDYSRTAPRSEGRVFEAPVVEPKRHPLDPDPEEDGE